MYPNTPLIASNTAELQPGDLVDEREAAKILGTAVRTLRNWRALRKNIPFVKIGQRMVRYRRADLSAFIADSDAVKATAA